MTKTIEREPTLFRGGISTNPQWVPEVSKTGGNFGAGYIKNFAVITTGEALGHQAWVDDEFISQVATELAKKKKGVPKYYLYNYNQLNEKPVDKFRLGVKNRHEGNATVTFIKKNNDQFQVQKEMESQG